MANKVYFNGFSSPLIPIGMKFFIVFLMASGSETGLSGLTSIFNLDQPLATKFA